MNHGNNSNYGNGVGGNGNRQSQYGNKQNYGDQRHGRGGQKSMFKPEMILDPWQQLVRKMVPTGQLNIQELELSFAPTMSSRITDVPFGNEPSPSAASNSTKITSGEDVSDSFGDNFLVYSHHKSSTGDGGENEEYIEEDDFEEESDDIEVAKTSLLKQL